MIIIFFIKSTLSERAVNIGMRATSPDTTIMHCINLSKLMIYFPIELIGVMLKHVIAIKLLKILSFC